MNTISEDASLVEILYFFGRKCFMVKKKAGDYKEESRESFNKQAENYDSSYYGKHGKNFMIV